MKNTLSKKIIAILERDFDQMVENRSDNQKRKTKAAIATLKKALEWHEQENKKANTKQKSKGIAVSKKKPRLQPISKDKTAVIAFAKGVLERYLEHEALKAIIDWISQLQL